MQEVHRNNEPLAPHWPPTGSTGAIVLWCLVVVVLVVMVLVVVVANTSS
jgi:hypothetical protein